MDDSGGSGHGRKVALGERGAAWAYSSNSKSVGDVGEASWGEEGAQCFCTCHSLPVSRTELTREADGLGWTFDAPIGTSGCMEVVGDDVSSAELRKMGEMGEWGDRMGVVLVDVRVVVVVVLGVDEVGEVEMRCTFGFDLLNDGVRDAEGDDRGRMTGGQGRYAPPTLSCNCNMSGDVILSTSRGGVAAVGRSGRGCAVEEDEPDGGVMLPRDIMPCGLYCST